MLKRYSDFRHSWEKPYLAESEDRVFRNTFRDIALRSQISGQTELDLS